jgi:hypothetical protein
LAVDKLDAALGAVDWSGNVTSFLTKTPVKERLAACNMRLAIWSKQLEQVDKDNPALAFIREMQTAGQMIVALMALALYKPAAGSIRSLMETALYYTFFRTHHTELATLFREKNLLYRQEGNNITSFTPSISRPFRRSLHWLVSLRKHTAPYRLLCTVSCLAFGHRLPRSRARRTSSRPWTR